MTCNVQFEGVFCPSITITNADGTIDYDNWGKHLDHLIDAGIDGVLLFGSIGEFYAIDEIGRASCRERVFRAV